jgi:hypothetical protein
MRNSEANKEKQKTEETPIFHAGSSLSRHAQLRLYSIKCKGAAFLIISGVEASDQQVLSETRKRHVSEGMERARPDCKL